ncbi:uncharacterized protein LOC117169701 isoform X2 [Belonocnema kinseyi]|uniref:uncharacterized protein LOC117169701 isoform X2 n=1 Tax=Belonocnema kinseyi TaxID=2817044 RepID=UPI00143CFA68|nr:uncharacterized protein LOC117169701 isoform X2 [Belonocnema kinseyi]
MNNIIQVRQYELFPNITSNLLSIICSEGLQSTHSSRFSFALCLTSIIIMPNPYKKKCFVPDCKCNSIDDPQKIFIRLPMGTEVRRKWAEAVGRTGKDTKFHPNSGVYCCEDHFLLPRDVENWMDVKLLGKRIRLREGVLPVKRDPNSKSFRSLLKRPIIQTPDSNNIQEIKTEEILISSEDESEAKKNKYVKYCFVPNCNQNSLENPNKLYLQLPKGMEIRKKFAEVLVGKEKNIVFHENSEVFCCTDHLDLLKSIHLPYTTQNSESQANQENDKSLTVDIEAVSEDTLKLTQLLCEQSSSTESFEVKSEPLDDMQSIQKENSQPVLIKIEPGISDYVKLEPETEENVSTQINTEFKYEQMQIVEEDTYFSEAVETQRSEETKISENEVVVLRDDVPEHSELRSYLLTELSKEVGQQLETSMSNNRDNIQGNIQSSKPDQRSIATSIEVKYLSEDINRSLYQERSSEVLKLLREAQEGSGKRTKKHDVLIASCNLDLTKKLVKTYPLRYTGLPPTMFKRFMANVFRDTKLPYSRTLLVLLKIRENQSFERLGDNFGISTEKARKRFLQSVPLIANCLKKVPWPQVDTESEIPFSFDSQFENIKFIIDCLEIEVKKSMDAKPKQLLATAGKHCDSVKYLISYTKMGLISCVSNKYEGSLSDKFVLDNSGYLSRFSFTKKALALTDRRYPGSGHLFNAANCQLIRLGEEIHRLEWITCLKTLLEYVEKVMKRLREFRFISKHALLSPDLTAVLDDVVIIASAIVNAQGPIVPSDTEQN